MKKFIFLLGFLSFAISADDCQSGKRLKLALPIDIGNVVISQSYISVCDLTATDQVISLNNKLKNLNNSTGPFYDEVRNSFSKVYDSQEWLVVKNVFLVGEHAFLTISTNKKPAFTYFKLKFSNQGVILKDIFNERDSLGIFLMSVDSSELYSGAESKNLLSVASKNKLHIAAKVSQVHDKKYASKFVEFEQQMMKKNVKYIKDFFGVDSVNKINAWLSQAPDDAVRAKTLIHYIVPKEVKKVVDIGDVSIVYFTDKSEVSDRLYYYDGLFHNYMAEVALDSVLWRLISQ